MVTLHKPLPPPTRTISPFGETAESKARAAAWKEPRKVRASTDGKLSRWVCRACSVSHATRGLAENCCSHRDPAQTKGGELLPKGHRPHELVLEQLEARMQELEAQAKERQEVPPSPYPCAQCKWSSGHDNWLCENPLVKGFENRATAVDWDLSKGHSERIWDAKLCGREKALWEPNTPPPVELTRWQHLLKALFG